MPSKNKIKYLRSLHHKKHREAHQRLLVFGKKIIFDLIDRRPEYLVQLWGTAECAAHLQSGQWPFEIVEKRTLKTLSGLTSPPSIIALCKYPTSAVPLDAPPLLLYLHDIQDPGNMGTIIRTANWYGHSQIAVSPRCADRYSPKVIQSSMGCVFDMYIHELSWYEMVKRYPDHRCIAAHIDGTPPEKIPPHPRDIIIIGSEGQGVPQELLKASEVHLTLPGDPRRMAESLNAAISAGIICDIWYRRN